MKSSGVLAFYLSESEDPELWRALAQLEQDERTTFFRNALRHVMLADEESWTIPDVSAHNVSHASERLFSQAESSPQPNRSYGENAESDGVDQEQKNRFSPDPDQKESAAPSGKTEERDRPKGGRHTLTPIFSRSQSSSSRHNESMPTRIKQLFQESSNAARDTVGMSDHSAPASTQHHEREQAWTNIRQPELKDVAFSDVFSAEGNPNKEDLRGLAFLLKNVIGEETDETVKQAIRHINSAQRR